MGSGGMSTDRRHSESVVRRGTLSGHWRSSSRNTEAVAPELPRGPCPDDELMDDAAGLNSAECSGSSPSGTVGGGGGGGKPDDVLVFVLDDDEFGFSVHTPQSITHSLNQSINQSIS